MKRRTYRNWSQIRPVTFRGSVLFRSRHFAMAVAQRFRLQAFAYLARAAQSPGQ